VRRCAARFTEEVAVTGLDALWLPILLSAVIVFAASSVVHMVMPWHKGDYPAPPEQEKLADALRPFAIPPGDYMLPRARSRQEMSSPEFNERLRRGPVMVLTVMPSAPFAMGGTFVQWFVYLVVIGVFAAYVAGRALPPGAHYLQVFRFAGVTAFASHVLGLWPVSIWYRRSWLLTLKTTFDGLLYALLTAGTFGWLWPR
jgi:hypothetical protein